MCRKRYGLLWQCALVTWLLVISAGAVTRNNRDHDDVAVEEMLRREGRDTEQLEREGSEPVLGLPVEVRHRSGRTRQQWRQHRPRHSGRQELKLLSGPSVSGATADYEQQLPKASGLWPSFFNVALRATISVNATCGQTGREEYCRLTEGTGRSRGAQCGICDSNNPDPEKRHPITNIVDGTNSWWQSPTLQKGAKNDRVTINLDLGQLYQIVFFTMRAAISPLPAAWVLEKSQDGRGYEAWQYFAADDTECRERFGLPAFSTNYIFKSDTEVICTTQFSGLEPLENGEINMSLISGRPSEKMTSPELQNFTLARYVRIRLLRMQPAEPQRSFYTIRSMRIGGRCFCSGHAGKCKTNDNNIDNEPQCECVHNTCGTHCDRCCPLYNQRPYRVGTPIAANKCEKCECNGHAKSCIYDKLVDEQHLSMSIRGKMSGGGVCQNCTEFTTGINCEQCLSGYYRPVDRLPNHTEPCLRCNCTGPGATGECNPIGGDCRCRDGFTGPRCSDCLPGHSGDKCSRCECDARGTIHGRECDEKCSCKAHVIGDRCDQCAEGYFALSEVNSDGCLKCYCSGVGTACSVAHVESSQYETMRGWTVTNLAMSEQIVPTRDNDTGFLVFGMFEMPETEAVYWKAPEGYLGNLLKSYGSRLSFKIDWVTVRGDTSGKPTVGPSLVLVGRNGMKIAYGEESYDDVGGATIDVPLKEDNWYHVPRTVKDIITRLRRTEYHGDPVTRSQFMAVLTDVETVLLRGTYHTDQVESVLEEAQLFSGSHTTNRSLTTDQSVIEICECPEGYRGTSCEECAFGYVRIYETSVTHERVGRCIPCSMCNGHAASCDLETGECGSCLHNTVGTNCERCLPGYYGNATLGRDNDCRRCACPLEEPSNNFSPNCQSKGGSSDPMEYVCTQCPDGYTGDHCEMCDDGYYGEPSVVGSQCLPCPCHGGPCNAKTGECIQCIGNTEGWRCERCKTGYWGVPDDGCEPCSCSELGALENVCDVTTGQCICKPRYGGRRCDECDVGYGNLDLDCPACACHVNGSSSMLCNVVSGQCECNNGTDGIHCDHCREGFFGLSDEQPGACEECNCHTKGSLGPDCDSRTGQCRCKQNIEGRQCNLCRKGFWNLNCGEGCVSCSCDSNGSERKGCDLHTGQCFCKTGVTGVSCDRCDVGYFGFSANGCKRCEVCSSAAYVCDPDTGRCICPANSQGPECRSCIANTWGNEFQKGCKYCACDILGAIGQTCDQQTGQCSCKEGYTGRQCSECATGYYGYPYCQRCACDERGSIATEDGSTFACDRNGQCLCKSMVYGKRCDMCRENTFGLVDFHPEGCTRCFCFGRATECTQSDLSWGMARMPDARNVTVEYLDQQEENPEVDYLVILQLEGSQAQREDVNITSMNNLGIIPGSSGNVTFGAYSTSTFQYPLYFQLPPQFLGDRTSSYGGLLNYTLITVGGTVNIPEPSLRQFPLVQLHTHESLVLDYYEESMRAGQEVESYSVRLLGNRWRNNYDGAFIDRDGMMTALQNVRHIFLRGTKTKNFLEVVITNVTLDTGIFVAGAENNHAYGVERCSCPPRYSGLSCQDPGKGYYRHRLPLLDVERATIEDMIGKVVPCGCNGRSEECHPETGNCVNCRNNTGGDHCEQCAEGFYGDPNLGQCAACPCPETRKNFARGCTVQKSNVHCICKQGYTGALCDSCMRGYFGHPHLDNGHCEACECNREGSMTDECDHFTGECHCRPGITGRKCDRCKQPKHIVQDFRCKICDNCTVTLIDDIDVLASRLAEETSHIDRKGIPAPWMRLMKYENKTRHLSNRVARLLEAEDTLKKFMVDYAEPLMTNATRLDNRLNKIGNRAVSREEEMVNCMKRANDLSDESSVIHGVLRNTIRVLKNYGIGDHHIKLPLAVKEAEGLLDDIRGRYGEVQFNDTVLQCANKQFDHWTNVSKMVERQGQQLDDLKFEIDQINHKSESLQNYTVQVFRHVQETEVYQTTNQKHFDKVQDVHKKVLADYANVTKLLDTNIFADTDVTLVQLGDNYGQLKQDNGTLHALVDALNESMEDLIREKSILLETKIPKAIRHAEQLKAKGDQIKKKFQTTEDAAAKAMEASQAYENIISAIAAAQASADNATSMVQKADQLIHPMHDVTISDQSQKALGVSTNLTSRATKELNKAVALNETMIRKEKAVQSLKDQIWQTAIKNNNLMNEVDKVKQGDTMKRVQIDMDRSSIVSEQMKFVRQDAINMNSNVYKLKMKLKSLEPDWDTKFGMAEENVSQTFGNIRKAKDKLNGLEALSKTQGERFKEWNRTFSGQLQELRDRIAQAKHAAEGIRVTMESQEQCIRSYAPASFGPSTTNRIVMSIALTNPKVKNSPLVYIEGEGRRFVALELRQRQIRMLWSLDGTTVAEVTHPQAIGVHDLKNDDAWYFIDAKRTFNVATLKVRHMSSTGVLESSRSVNEASSPAFTTISVGPSGRIWVGGIPDDLRVPELEPSQGLGVALSQLYVDQRQVGLWHFTSSSGKCSGAMLGPQEVASSSNERNFNGNGYAVLQRTSRTSKNQFSLGLSFKTLDEDALIFLALDENNNRSVSLTLYQGRLVFRVDYGDDTRLEINTTKRYNTGSWVVVEASRQFGLSRTEEGLLKVNSDESIPGSPTKPISLQSMLPVLSEKYYLGGVPPGFKTGTTKAPGADHAFLGCIQGLQISGSSYDPLVSASHFGIETSCDSTIVKAGFYGQGHVEFPSFTLKKRANFGFVFRTMQPDCLLLLSAFPTRIHDDYDSKDTFGNYSVFLSEGQLHLWMDAGTGQVELVSNGTLNDGEYHVLAVVKQGRHVELRIDDKLQMTRTLQSPVVNMPGESGGLYIGGVPYDPAFTNLTKVFDGLEGVIANLVFNNQTLSFGQALNFTGVQMGRTGPPMGSQGLYTALMKTEPIGRSFKAAPEGCHRVGSYSYEPNAFKYGDQPQSYSAVTVQARNIWQRNFHIEFDFRTFYPNGILFVALGTKDKPKHFIMLALKDGALKLTVRGRKRDQLTLTQKLNDGQWHRVVLTSVKKKATLSISNNSAQLKLPKKLMAANTLHVGGLPDEVPVSARELQPRPEAFKGCLRKFVINNNTQDLARPGRHLHVGQCFPRIERGSYFPGDAYAIYKRNFNVGKFVEIELEVRTSEMNGILMSVADQINGFPALSLEISNGNIILSVDNGDGNPTRLSTSLPSKYTLCDNRWHNISALYEDHQMALRVNEYPPSLLLPSGSSGFGRVNTKAPLYIGGLPDAASGGTLLMRENFKGCIRNIVIRNERKDWTDMDDLHNVLLSECLSVN